jgi:hypothetical protein
MVPINVWELLNRKSDVTEMVAAEGVKVVVGEP